MASLRPLRIATRSSAQAHTQAAIVAKQISAVHPSLDVELVFIETTGDQRSDVPLHQIGGQGVFVKEVQYAVLDGRADLAVHSAKDLTSAPTAGLVIGAVPERRDPRDVLVGQPLDELAPGATIATGSVRRRSQLAALRPDLNFVELRGNIQTRLGRIPENGSIVMALAALQVLDLVHLAAEVFDPIVMIPQVGQGAIAVECRSDDVFALECLAAIEHPSSRFAVDVERAFLAELGGGCSMPVGAYADGGTLMAYLATDRVDGDRPVHERAMKVIELPSQYDHACAAARRVAADLRAQLS